MPVILWLSAPTGLQPTICAQKKKTTRRAVFFFNGAPRRFSVFLGRLSVNFGATGPVP